MKRDFQDYLDDIGDMIHIILEFTDNMSYEEFLEDKKTQFAVVRAFEVMGEAAKKIPLDIRDSTPTIPWAEMAGMRDKLIHEYFGVNFQIVFKTAREILPSISKDFALVKTNIFSIEQE